jgi:hypothetical protein
MELTPLRRDRPLNFSSAKFYHGFVSEPTVFLSAMLELAQALPQRAFQRLLLLGQTFLQKGHHRGFLGS